MTFDELCADVRATKDERLAMIWHLAAYRLRATVEGLTRRQTDE